MVHPRSGQVRGCWLCPEPGSHRGGKDMDVEGGEESPLEMEQTGRDDCKVGICEVCICVCARTWAHVHVCAHTCGSMCEHMPRVHACILLLTLSAESSQKQGSLSDKEHT